MKRLLVFAAAVIALSLVGSGRLLAQTAEGDPFLGAWRLNLAQSKIESLPPLDKPLLLTVQGQSDARLFILEGITTDEKNIALSFLIDWDGTKKSVIQGTGMPNGEDTVSANKVDDHTIDFTGTKAGKVVLTSHAVLSADGKTLTITSDGTNEQGKPTHDATVWNKK
jgi:hypothetical protein